MLIWGNETADFAEMSVALLGSVGLALTRSPRGRGSLTNPVAENDSLGSIPARAGEPPAVPRLLWGKVSGRYPDGHVDVTLDHGAILPHVPLLAQLVGRAAGATYLPPSIPIHAQDTTQGPYGVPTEPSDRAHPEYLAVVDWLEGSGRAPVVVGFLPPPSSGITPRQVGWAVQRHESGQWMTVDPSGNVTMGWPDGSTLSVTATGSAAVPSADVNTHWPASSGAPVQVHLALASGGATIDIVSRQVTINGGTHGVARVGDPVTVSGTDSAGDTFTATGTITSGSPTVFAG